MSAMVEVWMSELTKLRGKVEGGRKGSSLPKARERGQLKEKEAAAAAKESRKELIKVAQKDSTLSEDSVMFLLMDRFTPL